jgi:adenylate cyclase
MAESNGGSKFGSFIAELRRRRVIRVVILYAVVGWVIIEVASTIIPGLNLPEWAVTLIITLVALGFPLAVIMAWAFDVGPDGVHRTPPLVTNGNSGEPVRRATAAPQSPQAVPPVQPGAVQTNVARVPPGSDSEAEARRTIAVLPFVNMSGDAENEYFSDGVSEEILNLLAKLPKLKVSSRTSSFAFKGKEFDIPEVARRLGVSTVLEGSVRRAGDRVRITAQLIETESDSHLWSETYDRQMKDVFAIQDDIARSIVDALRVTLTPKERRAIQYVATSDAEAYDYYLRGRRFFYSMSKRNFHHAVQLYQKAIERDANYALAHAGIADAHSFLFMYGETTPENAQKSDVASRRAVELDGDSAEAHASRGISHSINKRYDEAEREFETAIMLNPALFEAHYFYARDCFAQGKFEKAARLFAEASLVNPTDYQTPNFLAMTYRELGRGAESLEAARKTVANAERHLELHPDDARALYLGATALQQIGETGRAMDWAERALAAEGDEPAVLYSVACFHSLAGNKERALDLLERAVDSGFGYRAWMEKDQDLIPLHGEPRFREILERLG